MVKEGLKKEEAEALQKTLVEGERNVLVENFGCVVCCC